MSEVQGRFAQKTAIVTGGGSGIGRATVERLLAEGARVVAADVSAERLDELAAEFPTDALVIVAGDVTSEDDIARIVAAAGERIDVLANVAGIMDGFLPAAEVDNGTWERVFAINVTAPMKLMRAVIPTMIKQGSGAIVNVASEAALRGSAAGISYTASKHAVAGMTKNTALVYAADGIRTNAIAPGAVITNIEAPMKSQIAGQRLGGYMGIIPTPADAGALADGIVWLASDEARNINGVILPSDGGWSAI